MKSFYLKIQILIVIALLPLLLFGQTSFMPVFSEGKSWEVATISWDYENFPNSNDTTGYYTISVCGDTIVNNLMCKKIEIVAKGAPKSSKTAVACERDGKVWKVNSDGELRLIFNIGLHQYDEVDDGYVLKEDFISVNGFNRKRLLIDSGVDRDDYCYYVVEGIGISSDKWLLGILGIGNENEYSCMISCSDNGEIIFTNKDFSIPPNTTAIGSIEGDKHPRNVRYYNLAGVESAEPQQGVNIKVTTYTDGTIKCEKVLRQSTM